MTKAFTVVIPARYASTRLPGKPLQDIAGQPMIQRVWNQARKSAASRVVVATDDERILAACQGFGAEALLTRAEHNSGTDRLEEVASRLGLASDAIVVNVQGDEPLIPRRSSTRWRPTWRRTRKLPSLPWPSRSMRSPRCSIRTWSRSPPTSTAWP